MAGDTAGGQRRGACRRCCSHRLWSRTCSQASPSGAGSASAAGMAPCVRRHCQRGHWQSMPASPLKRRRRPSASTCTLTNRNRCPFTPGPRSAVQRSAIEQDLPGGLRRIDQHALAPAWPSSRSYQKRPSASQFGRSEALRSAPRRWCRTLGALVIGGLQRPSRCCGKHADEGEDGGAEPEPQRGRYVQGNLLLRVSGIRMHARARMPDAA